MDFGPSWTHADWPTLHERFGRAVAAGDSEGVMQCIHASLSAVVPGEKKRSYAASVEAVRFLVKVGTEPGTLYKGSDPPEPREFRQKARVLLVRHLIKETMEEPHEVAEPQELYREAVRLLVVFFAEHPWHFNGINKDEIAKYVVPFLGQRWDERKNGCGFVPEDALIKATINAGAMDLLKSYRAIEAIPTLYHNLATYLNEALEKTEYALPDAVFQGGVNLDRNNIIHILRMCGRILDPGWFEHSGLWRSPERALTLLHLLSCYCEVKKL